MFDLLKARRTLRAFLQSRFPIFSGRTQISAISFAVAGSFAEEEEVVEEEEDERNCGKENVNTVTLISITLHSLIMIHSFIHTLIY